MADELKKTGIARDQSGQAVIEYILLLSVIVSFVMIFRKGIERFDLANKLARPVVSSFAAAYQFGHPKAKGFDSNGGPAFHPRAPSTQGEGNYRLFIYSGSR